MSTVQRRRIALLGATGSIGSNALRVIRAHPDHLELVSIAGGSRLEPLATIAREFGVREVCLFDGDSLAKPLAAAAFPEGTRLCSGLEGLSHVATLPEVDLVLIAVVGTTALHACMAAIRHGKQIALASKEILVMAGEFIMPLVRAHGTLLLPTDSEHNAIFQCLQGAEHGHVEKVILTASGGRYWGSSMEELARITPEDAVRHPNWSMGRKISIDSSTMANKGLEVIEARWLFDLLPHQVEVVVHPQSLVHSMVQFRDGAVLAQICPPNMSFAIQHCLLYPQRLAGVEAAFDWSKACRMEYMPPDFGRFPCLKLAYEALEAGKTAPAVYNAANEVAVAAFCENRISFLDIPRLIRFTLDRCDIRRPSCIEDIIEADRDARRLSATWIPT
jgi:1-deoxy-D-xylulose-5-phosphate reductoisomerase